MNVIFLDFDGVLDTYHITEYEDIEKKIMIIAEIAKEYNCKIVIEAAAKNAMDEETLEIPEEYKWPNYVVNTLRKYGVEVIGRTPNVEKKTSKYSSYSMWKEDEIRLYLFRHPEIDHFCIIDDDDLQPRKSDLNKLREYLIRTINYDNNNYENEGITPSHIEEVGKVLKLDNKIQKYAIKHANNIKERKHEEDF